MKVIEFDDLDLDAATYKEVICEAYPQLRNCGGFMFFKCTPNTRNLEALSKVVFSAPRMSKERVGMGRTYICPIQRDLDLSAIFELPAGVRSILLLFYLYEDRIIMFFFYYSQQRNALIAS